ncbi:hypothetical protein EGH90_12455 [Kaistella haifensis]|nr:hypothetical protein EGH90_12455 [Kaistella haifensis]
MTSETFILLLKAKYKNYFENGESVGLDVAELVEEFRNEAISDYLKKKTKRKPKSILKKPLKPL